MGRRRRGPEPSGDDRRDITRVFRNPPQLALLARLLHTCPSPPQVRIYGVADGAEAVSVLVAYEPTTADDLVVEGLDVDDAHLAAAAELMFLPEQFPAGSEPDDRWFERVADGWRLRDDWRPAVRIERGDLRAAGESPPVDLVMCQNTLVSFPDDDAREAVGRLTTEVRPGGWLAVGGGRLDVVPPAALAAGLEPVLDDVEAIHDGWEVQRSFWANARPPYWALEPVDPEHPDGPARYATVFARPVVP